MQLNSCKTIYFFSRVARIKLSWLSLQNVILFLLFNRMITDEWPIHFNQFTIINTAIFSRIEIGSDDISLSTNHEFGQ